MTRREHAIRERREVSERKRICEAKWYEGWSHRWRDGLAEEKF